MGMQGRTFYPPPQSSPRIESGAGPQGGRRLRERSLPFKGEESTQAVPSPQEGEGEDGGDFLGNDEPVSGTVSPQTFMSICLCVPIRRQAGTPPTQSHQLCKCRASTYPGSHARLEPIKLFTVMALLLYWRQARMYFPSYLACSSKLGEPQHFVLDREGGSGKVLRN
jgi:hypothetical protein